MIFYSEVMSTTSKKYYVEFVGQHTAGKTTIIRHIVDNGLLEPKIAIYPQKIKRSKIHFAICLPMLALKNIRNTFFILWFLMRHTKWSWINYHSTGRHLLKMVLLHPYYSEKFDFEIWMKDDMLHLLPRLQFRKNVKVKELFQKYFSHFSKIYDGIVFVDLPYDVMKARFQSRFKNRNLRRMKNRTPVYERAYQQNLILKEVISEQKDVPYLIISGTEEPADNAKKVVEFVKQNVYEK